MSYADARAVLGPVKDEMVPVQPITLSNGIDMVKTEATLNQDALELKDWSESRGVGTSIEKEDASEVEEDSGMNLDENEGNKPALLVTPQAGHSLEGVPFPTPTLTPRAVGSSQPFIAQPSTPEHFTGGPHMPPPATPPPAPLAAAPTSPAGTGYSTMPLDRLLPVGTIVLLQHRLALGVEHVIAEDGWFALSRGTVEAIPREAPAEAVEDAPAQLRENALPSPAKKGAAKGRKRRASVTVSRKAKKARLSAHPHLEALITMASALVLRATARDVGGAIVVRVYLIPQDLPELEGPGVGKRRARPAGSSIIDLLSAVRADDVEWAGDLQEGDLPGMMAEPDTRSLLEVYRDIEAPNSDLSLLKDLDAPEEIKERLAGALTDNQDGVETELFPYQRATLAKMLARELAPQDVASPRFIRRSTRLGGCERDFFVASDGSVRHKPLTVREPKGGILAEDMGVGKTLIVLSLILSTRSELPELDDKSTSPPPAALLTNLSLKFPFAFEIGEAKKLEPRVPALLPGVMLTYREEVEREVALAHQSIRDAAIPELPFPSLRSLMAHKVKTSPIACRYPHPNEVDDDNDSGEANRAEPLPQKLFDLLESNPPFYRLYPNQGRRDGRRWNAIKSVKIIVAPTTLVIVPTDLVRQWVDEVTKHIRPKALRLLVLRTAKDKFPSAEEMASYDMILLSSTRFAAAAEAGDDTLRGVHWRRVLIDEGHVLASTKSRVSVLAHELRAESRWAVSGTPSTNLRGGETGEDGEATALFAGDSAAGGDRVDLDRLGRLFSHFLEHAAFPRNDTLRKLVETHVLGGGERASRLQSVFDRAIIRHHSDVLNSVIKLPKMETSVVEIEMEEGERRVYNTLVGLFVSNAITSQRIDVDYLFHKSKLSKLAELCDNLATATTFFGSFEYLEQVTEARSFGAKMLGDKRSAEWSAEDREQERKVVEVFQEALSDPEIRLTAGTPAVAMEVAGLDNALVRTFGGLDAHHSPHGRTLLSQHDLVRMRVDLKELQHDDVKAWDDDEELVEELITFEEKRRREDARPKDYVPDAEEEPLFKRRGKKDATALVPLPVGSLFRQIQLVRTTSSKINYIVSQLRKYPDEKFIIFSSSNVDLLFSNLSETLDLVGISHAIFATGHARVGDRGATAQRFNATSARECQAILVDAKLGGRGITLTAATRMIFLEPVWKPDLEVQASKRAHRLGQTKPVFLQILVVKSTFEDALLQRRSQLKSKEIDGHIKAPQQDLQLRTRLQQAAYLEPSAAAREGKPVSPAFDPPVMLFRDEGEGGGLLRSRG